MPEKRHFCIPTQEKKCDFFGFCQNLLISSIVGGGPFWMVRR